MAAPEGTPYDSYPLFDPPRPAERPEYPPAQMQGSPVMPLPEYPPMFWEIDRDNQLDKDNKPKQPGIPPEKDFLKPWPPHRVQR